MTIKDLKKAPNTNIIATQLNIPAHAVTALLELCEKGKIAKPDRLFEKSLTRINPANKYPFTYIQTAKQANFFMNFSFPLGLELNTAIQKISKELAKEKKAIKKAALSLVHAFYLELQKLKPKSFAQGVAKHFREETTPEGLLEIYMEALPNGFSNKRINRKLVPDFVNNFRFQTKQGSVILFEYVGEEGEEGDVVDNNDEGIEGERTEGQEVEQPENFPIEGQIEGEGETTTAPKNPIQVLRDKLANLKATDADKSDWAALLGEIEQLLTKAKGKSSEALVKKLKKEAQINYVKSTGINVKNPDEVSLELEQIVQFVHRSFNNFMLRDLRLNSDFGMVNNSHTSFYYVVMSSHSMMNILAKNAGVDLTSQENFDRFKKPVSLALQQASKTRNIFKSLAINHQTVCKLAEKRAQVDGQEKMKVQEKMDGLLRKSTEQTNKLLTYLNKAL